MDTADVRYATSGDARIAFTVRGDGPHEIVLVPGWISNKDVEHSFEFARFLERLTAIATVVSYDQRGTGLSDPVTLGDLPTLEHAAGDLHAVVEAAGFGDVVLVTEGLGGPVALLYAASRPERTRALVLLNTFATLAWSDDYQAGVRADDFERFVVRIERVWGTGAFLASTWASEEVDDVERRRLARQERMSMTPAVVGAIFRQQHATDVRAVLPAISAQTLVLHNVENRFVPIEHGRYLAQHIRGAQLVELPGAGTVITAGSQQAVSDEIEEFLTGTQATAHHDRMLTTLLFVDAVRSTERVAALGDLAWRRTLDHFDASVRHQLKRFSGEAQKVMGDGTLATFDGPARAIRCGVAIREAARQIDLEVRVGIHTGEVEVRGSELAGIAIHLAHRVSTAAAPGEVLVTRTVVDLVAGSGLAFDDRGDHDLKGIPTAWQLFSVTT
jgi:pimeloyl-ACP methyl ester carboxylesterase